MRKKKNNKNNKLKKNKILLGKKKCFNFNLAEIIIKQISLQICFITLIFIGLCNRNPEMLNCGETGTPFIFIACLFIFIINSKLSYLCRITIPTVFVLVILLSVILGVGLFTQEFLTTLTLSLIIHVYFKLCRWVGDFLNNCFTILRTTWSNIWKNKNH